MAACATGSPHCAAMSAMLGRSRLSMVKKAVVTSEMYCSSLSAFDSGKSALIFLIQAATSVDLLDFGAEF